MYREHTRNIDYRKKYGNSFYKTNPNFSLKGFYFKAKTNILIKSFTYDLFV